MIVLNPFLDSLCNSAFKNIGLTYRDGSEELYDRKLDPHEWNNRAADPKLKEVKQRLSKFVPQRWAKPALNKKAFQFNPHTYTWKHKKTGQVTEGRKNP